MTNLVRQFAIAVRVACQIICCRSQKSGDSLAASNPTGCKPRSACSEAHLHQCRNVSSHFFFINFSFLYLVDERAQKVFTRRFCVQAPCSMSACSHRLSGRKKAFSTYFSTWARLNCEFLFCTAIVEGKKVLASCLTSGRRRRLSAKVMK